MRALIMLSQETIDRHVEEVATRGYTVIERAIAPDLVAELKDELLRVEREHGFGYRDTGFEGTRTVRVYNLLAYGPAFAKVPAHEHVLPIVECILDPGLQLSSLSAITLGPGQEAQPMHADTQLLPLPRPHVPISVNAMWALSDFTEANGATRVVPGSHTRDHAPVYGEAYDSLCAEMPAGSVMLFESQLWHAGGANRTSERRFAIACYYCAGWIRQQENQYLGVPLEVMRTFPRRVQELCGYSVYKGQYGHIENNDPIELLGRERTGSMVWQASDRTAARRRGKA
jgi:ectoine hydroxylase-related dioxygenase (phytanoyl-CoA dioxygenase family)